MEISVFITYYTILFKSLEPVSLFYEYIHQRCIKYSRNQSAVPYREWHDFKQIELWTYQPAQNFAFRTKHFF